MAGLLRSGFRFPDGRDEQRPALAVDKSGDLWIASQTDGKSYLPDDTRFWQYDLYAGKIDLGQVPGSAIDSEYLVRVQTQRGPSARG